MDGGCVFAARFELPFGQVVRCHVTAILRPCRFRGISLATRDRQRDGKWKVGGGWWVGVGQKRRVEREVAECQSIRGHFSYSSSANALTYAAKL